MVAGFTLDRAERPDVRIDKPVYRLVRDQATRWAETHRDRDVFLAELEEKRADYADVPGLFSRLDGRDVVLAFIESYGAVALEDPRYAPVVGPRLDDLEARVEAAELHVVSGWLVAPSQGGQSWFGHGSMLSGLWLDTQVRYDVMLASGRETLVDDFRRAGYRTAALMPAITMAWPEGARFGYDEVWARGDIDYAGPPLNWVTMPDQFTWSFLENTIRVKDPSRPLFAEVGLISSHAPWTPILPVLDEWDAIGDGSVFAPWENARGEPARALAGHGPRPGALRPVRRVRGARRGLVRGALPGRANAPDRPRRPSARAAGDRGRRAVGRSRARLRGRPGPARAVPRVGLRGGRVAASVAGVSAGHSAWTTSVTGSSGRTAAMSDWLGLLRSFLVYWRPGRQRGLRELYAPLVRAGDLVFDVGAHLGDRTMAFAGLGARVVAFEPQPFIVGWLRRVVRHHGRVTVRAVAVGREPGVARLAVSRRTPTVSTLSARWQERVGEANPGFRDVRWDRTVDVPVVTLDEAIRAYGMPAFCKVDVEGLEPEVLAGLSTALPALSLEFVPGDLASTMTCIQRLTQLGEYEYNVVVGERRSFEWSRWQAPETVVVWLSEGASGARSGDVYARLVAERS